MTDWREVYGHWPDWREGSDARKEVHERWIACWKWNVALLKRPGASAEEREDAQRGLEALKAFNEEQGRELAQMVARNLDEATEMERQNPGWDSTMSAEAGKPELLPHLRQMRAELGHYLPHAGQADRVANGVASLGRWQRGSTRQRRSRVGARRHASSTSRDGPLPSADDDPPDAALTPLQRATLLLLEAIVRATEGGAQTFATFLDFAAMRIAQEIARLTHWDERQ
jgi:hypothetical protein